MSNLRRSMKQLARAALGRLGYRVEGIRYRPRHLFEPTLLRFLEFDDVVCRRMIEFGANLSFVQIGVYDGITNDPLRKYIESCGWRGVMVEPQARAVQDLRALYQGSDRVTVIQAALDSASRKRALYTVEAESVPKWAGGLASFDRSVILKHSDLIPELDSCIREEIVDCVSFDSILDRLPSQCLDILQIDTEGADAYILSLFPFDRMLPAIIHWEVKHLSKAQREDCLDRLAGKGYRFAESGGEDMMAVQSW